MVAALQKRVVQEGRWQAHTYEGFHPVACDLTAFYRPTLQNCQSRHYCTASRRKLTALPFGLVVRVGSVDAQRVPIPVAIVRPSGDRYEESQLMRNALQVAVAQLGPTDAMVVDRGFGVVLVQECGIHHYVARCAKNFTACQVQLPAYRGHGRRPVYGAIVRPLPRTYKGRLIEATPADSTETWQEPQGEIVARVWNDLTTKTPVQDALPFRVVAIYDPRYREPLLLATTLPISARAVRDLYMDRWPVEMVPQTAKQMLGAERQFVFAQEARQRLPEVALIAACTLLYTAATQPACPSGFWDRNPRPTSGRLRRVLTQAPFPDLMPLPPSIRKKNSVTDHLPKGVEAHRRKPSRSKPLSRPSKAKQTHQVTRN
jgi:hypothetical protein